MLFKLIKILITFLMLGTVNADPSIFNLADRSPLETEFTSGDEYISSLYTTGINYDTSTIDSLLITSGYEPLGGGFSNNIIKTRTVVDLTNPFGVAVDGCGTVTANLDEALAVLLHALTNALGVIPNLAGSRMFGLPNFDNPKEVFNWVYDMTTTVMCLGTSGVTTAVEAGVRAAPAMIKNLLSTWNQEEEDNSTNTQIGALCGYLQTKDDWNEKKGQSTNKNAESQTAAELAELGIIEQNKKFHKCKTKYEDYKTYLSEQISLLDIYRDREVEGMKTSCDLLDAEEKKESGDALLPNKKTWTFPNPFYLDVVEPEILSLDFGVIDVKMKFNENNKAEKTEIIIDKQKLLDQVLNIQGKIPYYTSKEGAIASNSNYVKNNEISDYIFDIGINYANIVTGCFNGDPSFDHVCKSDEVESYFPMEVKPTVANPSLLELVSKKRMFCDLTYFNKDNKDFLLSSIGLVTLKHYESKGIDDEPSMDAFKAAINTVILGDYCKSKLDMDLALLEKTILLSLKTKVDKINQKERGLLSAARIWKDQEMVVAIPAQYGDEDVIKVCNVHKKQKNFYIATIIKNTDKTNSTIANIHEIQAKHSFGKVIDIKSLEKDLMIKIDGQWDECVNGDKKCNFIENGLYSPFEMEMLCDGTPDMSACDVNKLSCGINFSEKEASEREDKLYVDDDSETKPKGKYAIYKFKQKEAKDNFSEDDFNEKMQEGFTKDIDKILYFAANVLSPASKDLEIFIKTEIKKILISLRN